MTAFRFICAMPFRVVMFVAGLLGVVFLIIGTGAALVADVFGGDRS